MKRALNLTEFLASPLGCYVVGRRSLAFMESEDLLGFATWGRPDAEDIRELFAAVAVGRRPGMKPYKFLFDGRALEFIDPTTFGQFYDYTKTHGEVLKRNIWRQAQIRPDGLVGAIIQGFARFARLPYPDRVFEDVDAALDWLGIERERGHALIAELHAIRTEAQGEDELVVRLRRELRASGVLTADRMSKRLGVSTRSLQRSLRAAGTTYRIELSTFRVERAKDLLAGDRSMTWIARELGFSTVQHFATAFRRAVGQAPAAWRSAKVSARSKDEGTTFRREADQRPR